MIRKCPERFSGIVKTKFLDLSRNIEPFARFERSNLLAHVFNTSALPIKNTFCRREHLLNYRILLTAVLALFVAGSTVKAETTLLLDYKDWRVELGQYEIDHRYCVAETINREDEVFSLTKASDEALNLLLSVDGANWSMRFVDDLVIQIDDQKWWLNSADFVNLNGESIVIVSLEAQDRIKWQNFLGDLAQGETVELMDKYGDMTLAKWSLFGSAAALLKMSECTNNGR